MLTRTQTNNVKSVVATNGSKTITFTITENKKLMSDTVAYIDRGASHTITLILPEGEWKLTLYSDTGATAFLGEYDVTAQKN